jgi:hypothetical protein
MSFEEDVQVLFSNVETSSGRFHMCLMVESVDWWNQRRGRRNLHEEIIHNSFAYFSQNITVTT